MSKRIKRIISAAVVIFMMLQSFVTPLGAASNEEDSTVIGVDAKFKSVSVTDDEGVKFSQENKATYDSNLKISLEFKLPVNAAEENLTLSLKLPMGIEIGVREDGETKVQLTGELDGGYGTYYVDEENNTLEITFINQTVICSEDVMVSTDTITLDAFFSDSVRDHLNKNYVLELFFDDEDNTQVAISFNKEETEETQQIDEETKQAAGEESSDNSEQSVASDTRDASIGPFNITSDSDLMYTDITAFEVDYTYGKAILTYETVLNSNNEDYSQIEFTAAFGGTFDTTGIAVEVLPVVGGITGSPLVANVDYTYTYNAVTGTVALEIPSAGTDSYIVKCSGLTAVMPTTSNTGADLDYGPVGTAEFMVIAAPSDGSANDIVGYNSNFQPIVTDIDGDAYNENLHLNSILTGVTIEDTSEAGGAVKVTYSFSLEDLYYVASGADKMDPDTTTYQDTTNRLNVHAGDYFVFNVDTSVIEIQNSVEAVLSIGGQTIGYLTLDTTGAVTLVFTREAEVSASDITGTFYIQTVTKTSANPGDTITTPINGEGDSSLIAIKPEIEIEKSGKMDYDNNQVIWTITANTGHYTVKDMVIFDNRLYAAERDGTTSFSLSKGVSFVNGSNLWEFADDNKIQVVAIATDDTTRTPLTYGIDYTISSGAHTKSIELEGAYAETEAAIEVTIYGNIPSSSLSSGGSIHFYMNYASASGSNITTSPAKIDTSTTENSDIQGTPIGSAYVEVPSIEKVNSSSEITEINGTKYYKTTWQLNYNKAKAEVPKNYAWVRDQTYKEGASLNYAYYIGLTNSNSEYYITLEEPDTSDIKVYLYGDTSTTLTEGIDYTIEIKELGEVEPSAAANAQDKQYVVTIQFIPSSKTSSYYVSNPSTDIIDQAFTILYDMYAEFGLPSGSTGMQYYNYAVTGAGYYTYQSHKAVGFEKTSAGNIGQNYVQQTINVNGQYVPFDNGYRIYDILPQGHSLVENSITITTNGETIPVYDKNDNLISGSDGDKHKGYFVLVTGENFYNSANGMEYYNYDQDKDFYFVFYKGSEYTGDMAYSIVYYSSFYYESQDYTGANSTDYATAVANNTATRSRAYNYAYLYDGDAALGQEFLASAFGYYTFYYISTSGNYRYHNVNMVKVGADKHSTADSEAGITWRVYGNLWNNSLDGATLTDTLGIGYAIGSDGQITYGANLTQSADTSNIKLYVFNRINNTSATTTINGTSIKVPSGIIDTSTNLLDLFPDIQVTYDAGSGAIEIKFPSSYEQQLLDEGIIDSATGLANMRFVLEYDTELKDYDIDYANYSNSVELVRNAIGDGDRNSTYTDTADYKVEITEFTNSEYNNTKIGNYVQSDQLIEYTAILNKGEQTIEDDKNGNNPTIHDTLFYSDTTPKQQMLYLLEDTLNVYEVKSSTGAASDDVNDYEITKKLVSGVDYNLVYNQEALDGFDIVFTTEYGDITTVIMVTYNAAYNHVNVPISVYNSIYFVGYETRTTGASEVKISETTAGSGWSRLQVDVDVLKVDENGDPIEGVKFALYGPNGTYRIDTAVTNNDGVAEFSNLLEGSYLIYEVNTPDGYANEYNSLRNAAAFTVSSDDSAGSSFTYKLYVPLGDKCLELYKVPIGTTPTPANIPGSDTGTALADGSGTSISGDTGVSQSTTATEVIYLKFTNYLGYVTNVEFTKYDPYETDSSGATLKLDGVQFKIYRYHEDNDGNISKEYYISTDGGNGVAVFDEEDSTAAPPVEGITFTSGNDGKFTVENLPVGTYYLEEITAPSGGYELPSEDYEFSVTMEMIESYREEQESSDPLYDGKSVLLTRDIPNFQKTGSVTINKQDSSGVSLNNVQFLLQMMDDNGDWVSMYYDEYTYLWETETEHQANSGVTNYDYSYSGATAGTGVLVFANLPADEYRIIEVKTSSDDYALMAEPVVFTIPYELEVIAGTNPNTLSPDYDEDSTKLNQPGDDGNHYDYYYYYNLTFTVTNLNVWGLPEAGEFNGSLQIALYTGMACILAAAVLYVVRRQKKIKHHSRE